MSANATYLEQLEGELVRAGIGGARRHRILAEFADHLESEPQADPDPQTRLGSPPALARQFADELGTSLARTAAYRAFGALALAAALTVATIITGHRFPRGIPGNVSPLAMTLIMIGFIGAQVAFAAGTLGLLRALRYRHAATIPAAEAAVLNRRAAVGLISGALAMLIAPSYAISYPGAFSSAWRIFAFAGAAMGLAALTAAAPATIAAARLRPHAAGEAGDLLSDLGPLQPIVRDRLHLSPAKLAFLLAGALLVVLAAAGIAADDGYDGALRGLLEAAASLAGFAALGRYLGLRG